MRHAQIVKKKEGGNLINIEKRVIIGTKKY